MQQGLIRQSAYVQPEPSIEGPGICGLTQPFKVTALLDGEVAFDSAYTLDCPMIAALNEWVRNVVEPAAEARFNARVVEIMSMGSYACRGINGMAGARLSEHAFGNAIDISGFRLSDGRTITVVRDWYHGDPASEAFLRDVHSGACGDFTTVLGPGYNIFHYNHIHVDLAMRGNTSTGPRRVCRPEPGTIPVNDHPPDGLPEPPPLDEDMDVSQAGATNAQALALHAPGGDLDAAVPEPVVNQAYRSTAPVGGTSYRPYQTYQPQQSAYQIDHGPMPAPGSAYQPYQSQSYSANQPYRPYQPQQPLSQSAYATNQNQQAGSAYQPYRATQPQQPMAQPGYQAQEPQPEGGYQPPGDSDNDNAAPRQANVPDQSGAPEGRPADWDLSSSDLR
jgi:Extensin-like protein C-terminus